MPEDQTEGVEEVVEETTQSVPQDEAQEETQEQTTETDNDIPEDYPEDEAKRREAFIKMRQALKAQKRESYDDEGTSVLQELRKPGQHQLDPITPDTDINQVTARMTMAERMAYEARTDAQNARIELENQKLYRVAPELEPDHPDFKKPETKFLDEYIAGQIMMAKQMGKPYDIVKLAKRAKETLSGMNQSQKEQAATEAVQKLQRKEQASLEARGNSVSIPKTQSKEELRERMRRGDEQARTEYMKTLLPDDF